MVPFSSGPALGHELEILTKVLTTCTVKGEDPFVCLHCLTQLRHLLVGESQPLAAGGHLEAWLPTLVSSEAHLYLNVWFQVICEIAVNNSEYLSECLIWQGHIQRTCKDKQLRKVYGTF